MTKYQWRPGARIEKDLDAEVIGAEIERLEDKNGVVEPAAVVEAARSRRSPLHAAFEWDDTVAAEEHRKQQARQLVAALVIVQVRTEGGRSESTRGFQIARPDPDGPRGYVRLDRIVGSEDMTKQLIGSASRELQSAVRRFSSIAALGKYVPALEELIKGMREDIDAIETAATRRRDKLSPALSGIETQELRQ